MDHENDPGWKYLRRSREQMLEDQSRAYDSKKNVWIPDAEEGYIEGIITKTAGENVTVSTGPGVEKTVKKDIVQEMNPPKFEKTEDMSNLTFLNDASVLYNLRARYAAMLIYTYSGLFCVVINPYKRLPIYTDSVARMFMGKRRTEMPPHLFAVSDEAYRNMLQNHENQSMLITGESGAGKTENTKKVISYFAAVGAAQQETFGAKKAEEDKDKKKVTLEDQIVQTNPVLEAFGNAKTVRNNNSSRFGKFIRIHFSKQGRVASCDIEHYLLEKSRVIRQAPGERCYHIFYQVFSDFVPTLKKDLLLNKPVKDYWFIAQAELQIDGVNDKEEHQLTDEAFDILKFSPTEKMECYRLVAAMMHMGNMKFKQRPREEQAEPDGTDDAERAAKCFGIDPEEFLKALTRPRVKVGNEWVNKGQNIEQVNWAVGAMAKGLYSRIFNWLVKKYFVQRYALLAADESIIGKTDAKKGSALMLARLVKEKKLEEDNFRVGLTKVFFKAGIVAHLEDLRDSRLAQLITGLQAQIRWFYQLIERKRRVEKITALKVIQRNVRSWAELRTWVWFKLYGKVKPLINSGKIEAQYEKLQETVATLKDTVVQEEEKKRQLQEGAERLNKETADLLAQLEASKGSTREVEERMTAMNEQKVALEGKLGDANKKLEAEEARAVEINKQKKLVEAECADLKKNCQDVDLSLRKVEAEKNAKEHQIRALQDEMRQQDENISKLNKERKNQEEQNKKLTEDLQAAEEQNLAANKLKTKLMQSLEDSEQTMEREKRNRADMDKNKRKAEGELKIAQETLEELNKSKSDAENALRRKETELHNLGMKLEDEQAAVAKLQKGIQQDEARVKDLHDQLADEKDARQRADRSRADQQAEYDELTEQLEDQSRATAAQIELGKKKDAELTKLRRDLEECGLKFGEQLTVLKKKGSDAIQELSDQIEQLQKQKGRIEKEKGHMQREFDESSAALDQEAKLRADQERIAKGHEVRLLELRLKADEQSRQLQDFVSSKGRLNSENSDLARQVEELEAKIQAANRLKLQFSNELDHAKRQAEEESRERQNLSNLSKNLARELEQLKESIEDEVAGKNEASRQLAKASVELDQWRTKFETEGLIGADEFDEVKKRQNQKTSEIQDALDACNAKIVALENARSRLTAEADANRLEAEHHAQAVSSLEKKQKAFDKVIDEWKKKVDDLYLELDGAQRDARQLSGEAHKLRGQHDTLADQVEGLRRENKALSDETRDLTESLSEGGRATHALSKNLRRLEMEKEELQRGLDEAEAALESEESKALRCQIEVSQIRAEIEKRIAEKEEEFENHRKVHQQTIDSIQATLDSETKAKSELFRVKKKLEADINELEIALDHANKANEDAQKNIRRYLDQIRELQQTVDEEQKRREEFREHLLAAERKLAVAKQEQEELIVKLEAIERARRVVESSVKEHQEHNNELNSQNVALATAKSQLDNEIALLKSDIAEAHTELSASEDRGRRAASDAAKLAEDLRHEQEQSQQLERFKKQLESAVKDLQERADAAEAAVMKGGAKAIQKAEQRLKAFQTDLETESRRAGEASKTLARADRKVREFEFQVAEDKKNYDKLQELVEKLTAKLKLQKKQLEEAEEQANSHLSKYRTVQLSLETAEERADSAEQCLVRIRSRTRANAEQK
ncbi:hypothetical protein L5515_018483 [Caenorhabditis briggsae]|uniref:Uncharacterized protein n=1 Tax=Caenorhabditis briggsae TaxID=6238 RepID=A0AAE9FGN1_CAEBR|nr:hypothetical protein L5515_018483 [Caenorhabditis briggsae]